MIFIGLAIETRRAWTILSTRFERVRPAFSIGAGNIAKLLETDAQLKAMRREITAVQRCLREQIKAAKALEQSAHRRVG